MSIVTIFQEIQIIKKTFIVYLYLLFSSMGFQFIKGARNTIVEKLLAIYSSRITF